jgi:nucleoside-diphosphate-sugar epimerase
MTEQTIQRVAITGVLGNLGGKLIRYLAAQPTYTRLVGLDLRAPTMDDLAAIHVQHDAEVTLQACDLTDWQDRRWRDVIAGVDAIVHFAAQNPFPEASWTDAAVTYAMTLNLARAAADSGVRRFVFASSNHVMGRYKDEPLASQIGPGDLHTDLEPGVGAIWHTGVEMVDSTTYAVPRVATEWLLNAIAAQTNGRLEGVCVRIGWCQPGENHPRTLNAAGTPTLEHKAADNDPDMARADVWYKSMWLSNRDFVHLFDRALQADSANWPGPFIIVNGNSNNTGMKWSLNEACDYLDYDPQDNVFAPE